MEESAVYRIETELSSNPEAVAAKDAYIEDNGRYQGTVFDDLVDAAFGGLTSDEYIDYIAKFFEKQHPGYENLTYKEAFYKPMMEVIDYLKENQFTIYLVSGSDQCLLWYIEDDILKMPRSQAIGNCFHLKGEHQSNEDSRDYFIDDEEEIVRAQGILALNIGLNKIMNFYYQVGKYPVMAFGNSSGDYSLLNYVKWNTPRKGFAMIVNHDDEEREYKYKDDEIKQTAQEREWNCVSIKNDFQKIFLNDSAVKKQ